MEQKLMSRRAKIRLGLYIGTVITVLGIFSIVQTVRAQKYEREAMVTKQMALLSLEECLNNISTNLEKTVYVSTPTMLSELGADLWREASAAKTSLSILPSEDISLNNTYKFLSQIGEFVMSLQRKSAMGQELTNSEREQLKELNSYCTSLNEQVSKMCFDLQNGSFSFEDYNSTLPQENTELNTLSKSLDDAEQSMTDLPSLIYDGPFSDHIDQGEPRFLEGLEETSENKALEVAKTVCIDEGESLEYAYDENGDIPCYVFQSDNCTVAITKIGGKPLYMINAGFAGEIQLEYKEAVENAKRYLSKIGYENMRESYYFTDDGICTVNFAATKGDVILYPDLIKVSVNLANGEIMSFDATGYVYNHQDRGELKASINRAQAETSLNGYLEIIGTQLCVIPTDWQTEKYCYEIHCKTDEGQELLVYVDCETGEEDNILILLYSDGGVLTK